MGGVRECVYMRVHTCTYLDSREENKVQGTFSAHTSLLSPPPIFLQVHLRSARRLCELCCANRGTFIKVGQHLGALDYLLPEEYTSTLKVLHSQAPQSSMQEVRQVIREDLGKEVPASAGGKARGGLCQLGSGHWASITNVDPISQPLSGL